ncbi:sensor histidine kinase [Arcicella rosea]|uniref:Sensor histidine kinase YesM n=1 Tax=Arcicella rosea TaxID=502909 RepID=A0A841EV68_9BACT|nr:histidine kinase [Arcicella rosea]MBB6004190.1 sensor histidine kinase YesM [Arcicella rosea]
MEKISELFLKIYPIEGVTPKRRVLLHNIFWLIMFISLWKSLMIPITGFYFNLASISYLIIVSAILFYITVYLVSPLWISKHKHRYLLTTIYVGIFLTSFIIIFNIRVQLIFHYELLKRVNVNSSFLNKFQNKFWFLVEPRIFISYILKTILYTLPAFFIKLIRSLVKNYSEKKQVEIDYLRSQINPHFLTNTLNNIYSLSVTDDKRNSDAILSLSSLLDYVLYESNQPTISLEREVCFLSNFIELEKMRNTKRLQVNFEVEGDIHGNIPPMILITFVENAFKHSIGDLYADCFIKILLKVDDKLYFEVKNSKSNLTTNNQRKTFGGIGLANVKKRLATLYPNTHSLQIENKENQFIIKLQLALI